MKTLGSRADMVHAQYDYVIVGAGSSGCVLARRLVERTNATVLILEAGPSDEDVPSIDDPTRWVENIGGAHDYAYRYEPNPSLDGRSMLLSRGKVLGGSGSINALVWARGHRDDFDGWAAAGNPGWDYESVLPLFRRSEDWEDGESEYRGSGGPMHIERARNLHLVAQALIDAGLSLGMPYLDDIIVPQPEGTGPINTNVRHGSRVSPSAAFLRPLVGHDRLTILTGAEVTAVRLAGNRCTGIEAIIDGAIRTIAASEEVILSAGAIDTPRLLMLSGIGPAADLTRLGIRSVVDLPGVGHNLQEHPIIAGLCFEPERALGPLNNNLEGSIAFWHSNRALTVPDLAFVAVQIPYVSDEIAATYPPPTNGFCIAPGLMRVESRGYLKLRSATPSGPLEVQANLLAEPADLDAIADGIELGLELATQPAFRDLIHRWIAPTHQLTRNQILSFARQACLPYFHPVGTCTMGTHEQAVVDPELRVHGIAGLRIADASIMPTITSANTQAPTVMIAERAADLITKPTDTAHR
ncbi:MAG: GMC family oxidoreductase N-terminal domain-containing protein [Solirubrobacterales bacterium]|nr:GMC family oxidoreductase N-terminal domain-containing protein [Solirubrobacterales bacterium]